MASLGLLMPAGTPLGSGGLYTPSAMALARRQPLHLWRHVRRNLGVRRYNPTTGAFIDFFANTGSDLYSHRNHVWSRHNLYVATSTLPM